nr:hypothetical protein CFP56_11298 [Quercus suber]
MTKLLHRCHNGLDGLGRDLSVNESGTAPGSPGYIQAPRTVLWKIASKKPLGPDAHDTLNSRRHLLEAVPSSLSSIRCAFHGVEQAV